MRITTPVVVIVALLGSACESQSQRSAEDAEKCREAERKGFPETAEPLCESAWFDVDSSRLAPAIQSERLHNLGRIKRKLGKFAEADPLLRQALAIEESVSGSTSPACGVRRVELALVLAGQEKWTEGAAVLEPVLGIADGLPEREQRAAANVFRQYARQLQDSDHAELGERFGRKTAELRAVKQGDTGQND